MSQTNTPDARLVADLVQDLTGKEKPDLSHQEIQALKKLNAEKIQSFITVLQKELSQIDTYGHYSAEQKQEAKRYWQAKIDLAKDLSQNYNKELINIKIGSDQDLAILRAAHAALMGTTPPVKPQATAENNDTIRLKIIEETYKDATVEKGVEFTGVRATKDTPPTYCVSYDIGGKDVEFKVETNQIEKNELKLVSNDQFEVEEKIIEEGGKKRKTLKFIKKEETEVVNGNPSLKILLDFIENSKRTPSIEKNKDKIEKWISSADPNKIKGVADAISGKDTKGVQWYLKTNPDGVVGPITTNALLERLWIQDRVRVSSNKPSTGAGAGATPGVANWPSAGANRPVATPGVANWPSAGAGAAPTWASLPSTGAAAPAAAPTTTSQEAGEKMKYSSGYIRDGKFYLTGPSGTIQVNYQDYQKNFEAKTKNEFNTSRIQWLAMILEAMAQKNPESKKEIDKIVKNLKSELEKHTNGNFDFQSFIASNFRDKNSYSTSETYIGEDPSFGASSTIQTSKPEKLSGIFSADLSVTGFENAIAEYIRNNFGNSDMAAGMLIDSLFKQKFEQLNTDKAILDHIASGKDSASKTADKAAKDADSDWHKNLDEYKKEFKSQYGKEVTAQELARAQEINRNSRMILAFKKESMMEYLEGKSGILGYKKANKDYDPKEELLSEILGTGTLRFSDRQVEISTEVGKFIAIEAIAVAAGVVTAGTATAAINAAVYGRHAYRLWSAAIGARKLSKTGEIATSVLKSLGGTGVGYETGAGAVKSAIEGKNMYSTEGFAQGVALGAVLGGLNKLYETWKLGKVLSNRVANATTSQKLITFTSQTALDGTAIGLTSGTIWTVFFEKDHIFSVEEIAQAMLMASLFRGMQMKVFKNTNGDIEVKQVTQLQQTTPTPKTTAEIEALARIASNPNRSSIGTAESRVVRKLLQKKEPLTQDDLKMLDERRQALNTEASALKVDDPRVATINKEVWLIEEKIRNSGNTPDISVARNDTNPAITTKPLDNAIPPKIWQEALPKDSVSREFSQAFSNRTTETYKVTLHKDGTHEVFVKDWTTWKKSNAPEWQTKANYDERIGREIQLLKNDLSIPQESRDAIADVISKSRYVTQNKSLNTGKITISGKEVSLGDPKYNTIHQEYRTALEIPNEATRSRALSEIDTRFAEKLMLDSGVKIVTSKEQARIMYDSLRNLPEYKNSLKYMEDGSLGYVYK